MKNIFKRIISMALIGILSLCAMCGCIEHPYQPFYDASDVVEINIVIPGKLGCEIKISEYDDISDISNPNMEIIKSLDIRYFDEIVADISSVRFFSVWNDPSDRMTEVAIQIKLKNGYSDFISAEGIGFSDIPTNRDGTFWVDENGMNCLVGYEIAVCDEPEKMQAIIDKWMNM